MRGGGAPEPLVGRSSVVSSGSGAHLWIYYGWRPILPDEADNHLIELGLAAQTASIVKRKLRDLARGRIKFSSLKILTPEHCLEVFPCPF